MYKFCFALLAVAASGEPAVRRVAKVEIEGSSPVIRLQTRAGEPYNPATIAADTKALYATGRVHDVTARVADGAAGKNVTFTVVPARVHVLREIRYVPPNPPVKLPVPERLPLHPWTVERLGAEMRRMLAAEGYRNSVVESELVPVDATHADVVLRVETGRSVSVGSFEFQGDLALPEKELRSATSALQGRILLPGVPAIWKGWKLTAPYQQTTAQTAAARITSLYLARGYLDALVRPDNITIRDGKADVQFLMQPGRRHNVRTWRVEGDGLGPRSGDAGSDSWTKDFCACLFDVRRASEQRGYVDFQVRARIADRLDGAVDVIATVDRGQPYTVRRIEIKGNHRLSDSAVRANLLIDEFEPLDQMKLRKSIARMNQSRMFQPLDERSVELRTDAATGMADVHIHLRERRPGSWLLSGPAGPMSVAGPLQFALASRLPAWGRGILEGATYFAGFSVLAQTDPFSKLLTGSTDHRIWPIFTLTRPWSPGLGWKSGFVVAPQLGWRTMALSYGMTQARERTLPLLAGDRQLLSPIPVTIQRQAGDAVLLCEPGDSRWKWLRVAATLTIQFGTSLLAF